MIFFCSGRDIGRFGDFSIVFPVVRSTSVSDESDKSEFEVDDVLELVLADDVKADSSINLP